MLIIVNFHYVRPRFDAPFPGVHGVTPAMLRQQLKDLAKVGHFVAPSHVKAALDGRHELPASSLLVTFDDGLREQVDHALPVLDELGIPALFFPNSQPIAEATLSSVHKIHLLRAHTPPQELRDALDEALASIDATIDRAHVRARAVAHYKYDSPEIAEEKFILNFVLDFRARDRALATLFARIWPSSEEAASRDLYMSREQLTLLARRDALGSHAHEHLPLGLLTDDELDAQLERSADGLAAMTGVRPWAISYPYGSREATGTHVAARAAKCGFRLGVTMERAKNTDLARPLLLARFDNNDLPGGKASLFALEQLFQATPASSWWS